MPALKHAILLTMTLLLAYLYLQVPFLKAYSLQFFAVVTVIYLIIQKKQRGRLYLIFPENSSFSLALINFAFLLLIGSSGSLDSSFFALTFVQLFFIALSAEDKVAIVIALEIVAFHFSLTIFNRMGMDFSTLEISNLLAIPLVMVFYLFGKDQYQKAYHRSLLLNVKNRELKKAQSDDEAVAEFLHSLLDKRMPMLEFLLSYPEKNKDAILAEMQVLKGDLGHLSKVIVTKEKKGDENLETLVESVEIETTSPHEK